MGGLRHIPRYESKRLGWALRKLSNAMINVAFGKPAWLSAQGFPSQVCYKGPPAAAGPSPSSRKSIGVYLRGSRATENGIPMGFIIELKDLQSGVCCQCTNLWTGEWSNKSRSWQEPALRPSKI